jgi:integrase
MPLTLVNPRPGRSPNFGMRGTVNAGKKSKYINETTGVANRKLASQIRTKREAEIIEELIHGTKPSHTFAEAAVEYVETVKPTGPQRDAVIGRPRRDGTVSPNLINDLGNVPVNLIDQSHVDRIIKARFANLKPGTVQRFLLTPLTAVLNFAAQNKWCDRPVFRRPRYDDRRRCGASYDEADRLLAEGAPHLRPLLLFLMLSGARIGEAVALDWPDVDLAARWLVLRDTKRGKRGADSRGEDRGVPIHPQLVVALANLPGERQGRVFRTQRGLVYAERNTYGGGGQIKRAWAGTCRRAGVVGLQVHDLRPTTATWLVMAGVHEQVRDEIMGHASSDMGRRYSHVQRPALIEAIDRLPARQFVALPTQLPINRRRIIAGLTRGKSVE